MQIRLHYFSYTVAIANLLQKISKHTLNGSSEHHVDPFELLEKMFYGFYKWCSYFMPGGTILYNAILIHSNA